MRQEEKFSSDAVSVSKTKNSLGRVVNVSKKALHTGQ